MLHVLFIGALVSLAVILVGICVDSIYFILSDEEEP